MVCSARLQGARVLNTEWKWPACMFQIDMYAQAQVNFLDARLLVVTQKPTLRFVIKSELSA